MNRRGFLASLLGLAAAPIAGVLPALAPREPIGWMPIAYYGVMRSAVLNDAWAVRVFKNGFTIHYAKDVLVNPGTYS